MTEPAALPAAEAARRIAAGTLKARDLAEAMLARIAAREPVVRAFVHLDPALVRRQADALDARGAQGPLAGLFLGVKDVIDTSDQPSQYGSPIWAGHRPRSDAACVALARRAGAVIAGKTVTTEFATRHPGATTNPHNPAHTPGGSSQGSAAGVGAGMLHLAFGTQTAGSIIRPAAYCGAIGFKPSYGTLHRAGMKVMSESLDTIGVMARHMGDVALAMTALTGADHGDPSVKPASAPRLALVMGPAADKAAPETLALMDRAAEAARRAGAELVAMELPALFEDAFARHAHVMHMESREALAWELDHARAQLSEVMRQNMDWAAGEPRAALEAARAAFHAAQDAFPAAIEGFDAVLTPAAPGEAPEGLAWTGDPAFNTLWTLLHVPCVTVPAGTGPKGLPLGVQVVTRRGEDAACLAWGEWVRQALG
ncbi:MAG: amidase [Rubritepida sp.]|nr:amidase [Rubritepida sp.]